MLNERRTPIISFGCASAGALKTFASVPSSRASMIAQLVFPRPRAP